MEYTGFLCKKDAQNARKLLSYTFHRAIGTIKKNKAFNQGISKNGKILSRFSL